ncbi:Ldh family oxidoreductase [Haladaptatus halobius]|uniref:Ldh family oxidoreductase n=1 Tax=Haladaptatus halobius TaxID=2884875 RepID=UPI001D0BC06E|nr:Ldh family oxidoreductase [Haladaptatus halobius]
MKRIDESTLESYATEVIQAMGAQDGTASAVANSLVGSDLRGHTSHGVLRLDYYYHFIEEGVIDPKAKPEVVADDGPTARIDGRNAFGQIVGRELATQLVTRVEEHGIAAVGVRDATHLGRVGEWAEHIAAEGYAIVGFINTQGGGQRVAPAGSSRRGLSTNPIVVGFPTFDSLPHDVVLDMATSQVAHGKLRERTYTNEPIPEGWVVDESGDHVRDVKDFYGNEAAIRPLGGAVSGYKGFGLAILAELMAGCLGAGDVVGMANPEQSNNAAGFLAVDVERFLLPAEVAQRVLALRDHLEGLNTNDVPVGTGAKGNKPRLPGAPEYEHLMKNREAGVPINNRLSTFLSDLSDRLGVIPPPALRE